MRTYNLPPLVFEVFDEICYKKEQNVIRVSGAWNTAFTIGGFEYTTDSSGKAVIDYSDIIRTYLGGEFDIETSGGLETIEFSTIDGIKPKSDIFPPRKLLICGENPFYIMPYTGVPDAHLQVYSDGVWIDYDILGIDVQVLPEWTKARIIIGDAVNVSPYSEVYSEPYTYFTAPTLWYCEFERNNCNCDNMLQLTWIGDNGLKKSYTFNIFQRVRKTTQSTEIEAFNENGFTFRKNFELSLKLRTDKLNAKEREYFSDLISSENVVLFDQNGANKVTCSETTFDNLANDEFSPLEFDVKFKQYVSI